MAESLRQTYQKKVALESPYIGNKVRFLQQKFQVSTLVEKKQNFLL